LAQAFLFAPAFQAESRFDCGRSRMATGVGSDGCGSGAPPAQLPSAQQKNLRRLDSNNSEMQQKAKAARAGFKRPAVWVMVFGWSLALCAGLVNVVCMQTLGTYVSHVTGSTTAIGLHVEGFHKGRHDFEPLGEAIYMLISFLLGAFLCGLLIDKNQVHLGGKSWYGVALVGNGTLLVLAVVAAVEVECDTCETVAACLAATACGLQNAMCTSHFGAVVRTTHVTGTITDIGSTLGRISMVYLRKGCRRSRLNVLERAEVGVDARKLLVLGPMWLSFLIGCIVGAYLGTQIGVYALLIPAGFTISVGSAYMLFRQRFKTFFQRLLQERLSHDLGAVEQHLSRTQGYLGDLRRSQSSRVGSPAASRAGAFPSENPVLDLDGLELEVEQILDSIHQVEVDLEDLQSQQASPLHRSDVSRSEIGAADAAIAPQVV